MSPENLTLAQLLRQRPGVLEVLEAAGLSVWDASHLSLDIFCSRAGMDATELLRKAKALPPPPADSDWKNIRLYRVADFLTLDHRHFREKDLPAFNRALKSERAESYGMTFASETFLSFQKHFIAHLEEEENELFPYLLRLDEIFTFPQNKEYFTAPENPHRRGPPLTPDFEQHIDRLAVDAGRLPGREMQEFRDRLIRHSKIETEALYPRLKRMEGQLALDRLQGFVP